MASWRQPVANRAVYVNVDISDVFLSRQAYLSTSAVLKGRSWKDVKPLSPLMAAARLLARLEHVERGHFACVL